MMAKQPRPFIGVNADLVPAGRHTGAFVRQPLSSIDAILTAGGLPVLIPPLPRDIDFDAYEVEQVTYKSKDGTPVTMFLAHRKGLKKTGKTPTLLYGYGGFNISLTPVFSASR